MPPRQPADPDTPFEEWIARANDAGWEYHRTLEGNAVSSPMGAGSAMSLLRLAAGDDDAAADVLHSVLGFPSSDVHSASNTAVLLVADAVGASSAAEIAHRLYVGPGVLPSAPFRAVGLMYYDAEAVSVGMAAGAGSLAAAEVSRWVADRTRGLVPRIADSVIVPSQSAVLATTAHLEAGWHSPFPPDLTSVGDFAADGGTAAQAAFMASEDTLRRLLVREDSTVVELAYAGSGVSMWVVIPHEEDGLDAVEESLDSEGLLSVLAEARRQQPFPVSLRMPRWKAESSATGLMEWLCDQGLCPGQLLHGASSGGEPFVLDAVLQGVGIAVGEDGTGSALPGDPVAVGPHGSLSESEDWVVADRPFLWAVVTEDTDAVLLLGRVTDPS